MAKSKKTRKTNKGTQAKAPVFIIERGGKAYFKDKKIQDALKNRGGSRIVQKYPNYLYEFDYTNHLDWFKKYVMLFQINGGSMRFIGITESEFKALGGDVLYVENSVPQAVESLKKNFFKK